MMLTLSLGNIAKRANIGVRIKKCDYKGRGHTVGRTSVALAVIAVVIGDGVWLFGVDAVSHSFTETVTGDRHSLGIVEGLGKLLR
jgi:hypothetical protein